MITLPSNKCLVALSGRSVDKRTGIPHLLSSVINCSNSPVESKESISKLFNLNFTSETKLLLVMFFI